MFLFRQPPPSQSRFDMSYSCCIFIVATSLFCRPFPLLFCCSATVVFMFIVAPMLCVRKWNAGCWRLFWKWVAQTLRQRLCSCHHCNVSARWRPRQPLTSREVQSDSNYLYFPLVQICYHVLIGCFCFTEFLTSLNHHILGIDKPTHLTYFSLLHLYLLPVFYHIAFSLPFFCFRKPAVFLLRVHY